MTKTFVLRPNALLSSSTSTLKFGSDNIVVIPMEVLKEVYQMKNLSIEKEKIRREIFEYLKNFSFDKLQDGVKQGNGSIIKIIKNFNNVSIGMWENDSFLTSFQKSTLKVCIGLKNKGAHVVLVTNNILLQMIAEDTAIGIKAENFKDETFPRLEEQYTGRLTVNVTQDILNTFHNNNECLIKEIPGFDKYPYYENQYVIFSCPKYHSDGSLSAIKAYGKIVKDKIVRISIARKPYGISALNDGQRLLIDALYDESPLTVVKGNAGTGKTLCSLAVALDELQKKKYDRILVTRKPDFSKIGFLPGEIENKMSPYLAGIKDNLSILINGTEKHENTEKKNFPKKPDYEDGQFYFEKGCIQIQAIELLRGRSIVNTLFIIDETQNIEPDLIKTIITRAGKGSKFIFLGDPTQIDNPNLTERYNGLVYLSEKMKGSAYCTQVSLMDNESVRSDLARYAAKIF